jgi:hypothetical protein
MNTESIRALRATRGPVRAFAAPFHPGVRRSVYGKTAGRQGEPPP